MSLNLKIDNETLIVEIQGELDHHTAEKIRDEIDYKLNNDKVKNILFDFSGLSFMDSSGIGVLMGRYKKISQRNGQAGVYNINSQVRRVFEVSGLLRIFKEFESKEHALENM